MPHRLFRVIVFASLVQLFSDVGSVSVAEQPNSDQSSQSAAVKLLLSDRCFLCHGPDASNREAGLRLDTVEGQMSALESDEDRSAVVPGDSTASELIARIMSDDPDLVMPPPDANLALTSSEKQMLKQWVDDGAEWEGHWSFQPIEKPHHPEVTNSDWCRNPIDQFVMARLEAEGIPANHMAEKERLIRRVTFDLTGLPPTLEEIDAFLTDSSEDAFEQVVDRLLASVAYGEHMTADWLDVARYSDTYGYQVDRDRYVWPWRDWVIRSFNENKAYDDFIVEQIAGDMLPDATKDQILATTFNRLHPQKVEGGSVEEEFRVEYVADRAQTVGTAFLGLTMECCRCHDHKYDPLSQQNYFEMFSFFNNIDEAGLYSYFTNSVPTPTLTLPTDTQEQQLNQLELKTLTAWKTLQAVRENTLKEAFTAPRAKTVLQVSASFAEAIRSTVDHDEQSFPQGEVAYRSFDDGSYGKNKLQDSDRGKAVKLTGDHGIDTKVGNFARHQPFTVSTWLKTPEAFERAVVFHRSKAWTDAASRGYELLIEEGHFSAALIHFWPGNAIRIRSKSPVPVNEWVHVTLTYDGSSSASGLQLWLNGEPLPVTQTKDKLTKQIQGGGGDTITIGQRMRDKGFKGGLIDEFRVFDRQLTPLEVAAVANGIDLKAELKALAENRVSETLAELSSKLPGEEPLQQSLIEMFSQPVIAERQQWLSVSKEKYDLQNSVQEIMVMKELAEPRPSWVLVRGAYDAHGDAVSADVPDVLPDLPGDAPANRLGLARWLVSESQPLTARVTVNRFWQKLFGEGLVRTPEDFGNQGMLPSHPALLDWLAADFREHGWDVKRCLKQIVMSSTYRQSSQASSQLIEKDPQNILLGRAPVFRLSAEMLRDNALAVSGLLNQTMGGPPVKPYELAASFKPSKPDSGTKLYRRSLYTYWRRTAPAPVMMTLDAAKRDVCRVKRERTASPLQALVVMNGPQFVEAARIMADRCLQEHPEDSDAALQSLYRRLTSQRPSDQARSVLKDLLQQQLNYFQQNPEQAAKYLAIGEATARTSDVSILAAWATVANTILALDDSMMRR